MEKWMQRTVWIFFLVPFVYLAFSWPQLPEKVALHFNLSGKPDRFGSKKELLAALGVLSVVNVLVYLLLTHIYRIDPKKNAADNKTRLKKLAFVLAVFLAAVQCTIIYSSTHGNLHIHSGIILSATGLLFAFIGNYMHNLKPNYFAGIRLPWTLENEENWKLTHLLAGKLWFAGGLLLAVLCLFLPATGAMAVFFSVLAIITIIPVVYSYRIYARQKKENR